VDGKKEMENRVSKRAWVPTFSLSGDENGFVLVYGLLVLLVLVILSISGMLSSTTELRMATNDRSAKEVFFIAEGGIEDARSRLQASASASPIYDHFPSNANWRVFIGSETRAVAKGFQGANGNHTRYDPLNSSVDYVVTITHKLDPSGNILKWGDSNGDGAQEENSSVGENIYVITSEGRTPSGAEKTIRIEAVRFPSILAPAALYTKAPTSIQGNSTSVLGIDPCGGTDVPGVLTQATVSQIGLPTITGSPPIVENSGLGLDISTMVRQFSQNPQYAYNVSSATLTNMVWGTPVPGATPQSASSCSQRNVVSFNTSSTYVKLAGGTSGCGILMVDGDLHINGGFHWYGIILVTGSVVFSGGGEKNVTGGILAGGTVSADTMGGDASIVYCSAAGNQTHYLPLLTLRWVELFS
jgi:Tfp pilus assembly protein PilX